MCRLLARIAINANQNLDSDTLTDLISHKGIRDQLLFLMPKTATELLTKDQDNTTLSILNIFPDSSSPEGEKVKSPKQELLSQLFKYGLDFNSFRKLSEPKDRAYAYRKVLEILPNEGSKYFLQIVEQIASDPGIMSINTEYAKAKSKRDKIQTEPVQKQQKAADTTHTSTLVETSIQSLLNDFMSYLNNGSQQKQPVKQNSTDQAEYAEKLEANMVLDYLITEILENPNIGSIAKLNDTDKKINTYSNILKLISVNTDHLEYFCSLLREINEDIDLNSIKSSDIENSDYKDLIHQIFKSPYLPEINKITPQNQFIQTHLDALALLPPDANYMDNFLTILGHASEHSPSRERKESSPQYLNLQKELMKSPHFQKINNIQNIQEKINAYRDALWIVPLDDEFVKELQDLSQSITSLKVTDPDDKENLDRLKDECYKREFIYQDSGNEIKIRRGI